MSPRNTVVSYDFLPEVGGAHMWLYEVYRRWPSPVDVLTAESSEDPDERAREVEFDDRDHGSLTIHRLVRSRRIDLFDPRYWASCMEQAGRIKRVSGGGAVCLHALRAFPEGIAASLYRRMHPRKARLVTYAHGEEILIAGTSRQLRRLARSVYARSDLVIANSENTRRLLGDFCPAARVRCIHPGVDVGAYRVARQDVEAFRKRWEWPAETIVVCTVARMEPRKNQAMVVRAVAELAAEGLPIAYVCAGDGPERERLSAMVDSLQLGSRVRFLGRISDREKTLVYAASDIHAMPSIQLDEMIEGFGIVFIEAAAAGLPSIAGNTGGQAEAVQDGKTGFVIDGTDLNAVSGAIRRLAENPALRRQMAEKGLNWARYNDWSEIVKRTRQEVEEIIDTKAPVMSGGLSTNNGHQR